MLKISLDYPSLSSSMFVTAGIPLICVHSLRRFVSDSCLFQPVTGADENHQIPSPDAAVWWPEVRLSQLQVVVLTTVTVASHLHRQHHHFLPSTGVGRRDSTSSIVVPVESKLATTADAVAENPSRHYHRCMRWFPATTPTDLTLEPSILVRRHLRPSIYSRLRVLKPFNFEIPARIEGNRGGRNPN
jgi:hypothetical protein